MDDLAGVPLIIAVTGHRDLRPQDVPALERSVRDIFTTFQTRYPATRLLLLSALAAGADRLVARVALALNIEVRVPMPLPEAEYRRDFSQEEDAEFTRLLERTEPPFAIPYYGDNDAANVIDPIRRAEQYAALGAYLARVAHVLIALWDGVESEKTGGTAQVVRFRRTGVDRRYRSVSNVLDAGEVGSLYWVYTPRSTDARADAPAGRVTPSVDDPAAAAAGGDKYARPDAFERVYAGLDRFNRDRAALVARDGAPGSTWSLRDLAERLATNFQRRYISALRLMFVLTVGGAWCLAFAHRDQPFAQLVLIYLVLIVFAFLVYFRADRLRLKDRYIEYRAFEFGLRLQRTWEQCGLQASVPDYYLRLQRSDLDWIRAGIRAAHDLGQPVLLPAHEQIAAVETFVAEQHAYFRVAREREETACTRYETLTRILVALIFVCSALLAMISGYLLMSPELGPASAPLGALFTGSAFGQYLVSHSERLVLAIALLTITVAASHEYPHRRAFHAQARRYEIMFEMYSRARAALEKAREESPGDLLRVAQDVAFLIGGEALAESGDWVMLHRDLPIEFTPM